MSADPHKRRQARIWAMQVLCQGEVQPENHESIMTDYLAEQQAEEHASAAVVRYAETLVRGFHANQADIDGQLAAAADRWELSRISQVERNIMRVALVELIAGDVPPKVAINEAIEIGKVYGGEKTPGFLNGVLDRVYRDQEPPEE